jgi:hypothetical protein
MFITAYLFWWRHEELVHSIGQPAGPPMREDRDEPVRWHGIRIDGHRALEQFRELGAILLTNRHGFGIRDVHAGAASV